MQEQLLIILIVFKIVGSTNWSDGVSDGCFCKLKGEVDDCSCKVKSLDSLNNDKIYPRLNCLMEKKYFRYFKVNLQKRCPFWPDDGRCALIDCHVDVCDETKAPIPESRFSTEQENVHAASNDQETNHAKYSQQAQHDLSNQHSCEEEIELSALDTSISLENQQHIQDWTDYDESLNMFCDIDDEQSNNMQYVDLLKNPERYTGYKGFSPHRIWRAVYDENCFKPSDSLVYGQVMDDLFSGMCLEKRVFHRMISGLHTSINIQLCDHYLMSSAAAFKDQQWGPNVEEFMKRFDPETSDGLGPQRLKNLYFTYLVELRALAKASPYFFKEEFYAGSAAEDKEVHTAVRDLLNIIQLFPDHFDESKLFQGNSVETKKLKLEFRNHFRNISRIMDCVGCDKCRLWGKVQVLGMGTALKILFSGNKMGPNSTVNSKQKADFQLTRLEIVALFNAFCRLSSSIRAIENFRSLMR